MPGQISIARNDLSPLRRPLARAATPASDAQQSSIGRCGTTPTAVCGAPAPGGGGAALPVSAGAAAAAVSAGAAAVAGGAALAVSAGDAALAESAGAAEESFLQAEKSR